MPQSRGSLLRLVRMHLPRIFPLTGSSVSQPESDSSSCKGWREAVRSARVVYFGERHEQHEVLASQLAVLNEMHAGLEDVADSWLPKPSGKVAVVFEMFHRPRQQAILDAFLLDERGDADALDKQLDSVGRVGFRTKHYGQLLLLARELGEVHTFAGFPPRRDADDSVKVAAKQGFARGLQAARQEGSLVLAGMLGADVEAAVCAPPCDEHYNFFETMFTGRDLNDTQNVSNDFRRIFPAQCVADAICAATVLERLCHGDKVLVILGCGHSDYGFSVPERVEMGLQALRQRSMDGEDAFQPSSQGDGSASWSLQDVQDAQRGPAQVEFIEHAEVGAVRITSRSSQEDERQPVLQRRGTEPRKVADFVCMYEA